MGTKNQSSSSDPVNDPKKRRRVGFSKIDTGIEPNECIKIYLVSRKEELDASNSFCIQPVDLNHFFGDEGKIYGYQNLQINIWVSSISFHAYADITFQSKADGGKGITDLRSALQDIFAENLVEKKDDFLHTFSTESDYINSIVSKGEILQQNAANGHNSDPDNLNADGSNVEIIRVVGVMPVGLLYSRLVPLVLLLVDGSNPIDITDPRWEILLVIQKKTDPEASDQLRLLGFAAIYRFYCFPDSLRLRLGQILVLPLTSTKVTVVTFLRC
ncbi:Histone acetyltransferase [Bertholletia excelsa]